MECIGVDLFDMRNNVTRRSLLVSRGEKTLLVVRRSYLVAR